MVVESVQLFRMGMHIQKIHALDSRHQGKDALCCEDMCRYEAMLLFPFQQGIIASAERFPLRDAIFANKVSAPEHFLLCAELCMIMNDLQITIFNYLNRREKHYLSLKIIQNYKCRFAYLKTSSSIISKRCNYFNMYC